MLTVANPIYDIVFKYLLEDERIARTIFSALLKKNVVKVEPRKHEYADTSRDGISMLRIDFGATIEEEDGLQHLVLIELQKTWIETETLRFRQYLGSQYTSRDNILRNKKNGYNGYALPMVAVYILGHRLGDVEEPVLYVHGKPYDYYGNEVTKGLPNPFVESLTHDCIFVQVPLLKKGRFNNRLEKVLSVFDQSRRSVNPQELYIDEGQYENDTDMMHIVNRLVAAASDHETRQKMNVEDEFFSAIEDRDTEILLRDKRIAEQEVELTQKDAELTQKGKLLTQKDAELTQKDEVILASAKMMLNAGIPMTQVQQATNLPLESLQRLI